MKYAQIRSLDISNGEGIGVSLFVQGCHFHCAGCFNQETWDFNGGKEWGTEIFKQFMALAEKRHITRISILGGEPLADENIGDVLPIAYALKNAYPEKRIWVYTGYVYEDIQHIVPSTFFEHARQELLNHIDVLCDGRFEIGRADPLNKEKKWVGSTNQRVIDVKETIRHKRIIEL